jgi:hypothetical protein
MAAAPPINPMRQPSAPRDQTPMSAAVDQLEATVINLVAHANVLEEWLEGVLRPIPTAPGRGDQGAPERVIPDNAPLVRVIRAQTLRLALVDEHLQAILDRLEV